MIWLSAVLPVTAALVLALVTTSLHHRLPPESASKAAALSLGVVAATAVPTLWVLSISFIAHLSFFGGRLEWCAQAFGVHEPVSGWIGVPAVAISLIGCRRAARVMSSYRQLLHHAPGPVEIVEHHKVFAYTLPGRGGHIVVSSALIDLVDESEYEVVLAHERAHARHRHDRFLLMAQVSAAFLPILRPLASRVQYALERWADEEAVSHCGDRRFVALTLGKVALGAAGPVGVMAFGGLGVSGRVAALLGPPVRRPSAAAGAALVAAIGSTGLLAVFQVHHLVVMFSALCPG